MKKDTKVIFFDLFYTLVTPSYNNSRNENDVLKMTKEEWEKHAENQELYRDRATGKQKDPLKIIESIIDKKGIEINEHEKKEILKLREKRFKRALVEIDSKILSVLSDIKKSGKKLCVISNADIIDVMHWKKSPLNNLFDETIFSYEVGYLKPQSEIYKIALKRMNASPDECIFIGDGGSDELRGAKELGIKTVLTGYLLKRLKGEYELIKKFADWYIEDFEELTHII